MYLANPYRPGAGKMPPLLAGRQELLRPVADDILRISEEGMSDQPYIFWGLRGLGKTVLLNEIALMAKKHDWIIVKIEASGESDLTRKLVQELAIALKRYKLVGRTISEGAKHALRVLKSFQLKFDPTGILAMNVELQHEEGYADSGDPARDLQDIFEAVGAAARDMGIGALIAVDELQEATTKHLKCINMSLHAIGQALEPPPVLFVGAGLPTLPSSLAKANTYAERLYRYAEITPLDDEAVRLALYEPAIERNVTWAGGAMDKVVSVAKGYPYFVQQCGRCIWDCRDEDDAISEGDAQIGVAQAQELVDQGLYRARWDRATPVGHEMMQAIAQLGGTAAISDVYAEMGRSSQNDISNIRDRLIKQGQIYSPSRGLVAFTIPGMADYILRNNPPIS